MGWIVPVVEAIGGAATAYSTLHQMKQAQGAQDQALAGPPPLTADQQKLADMLRGNAQQYLAPNYVQNASDQYTAAAKDAIDQAAQQASQRAMAHLAALGRSTGGAYNAVNADLAKQTAGLISSAKQRGLQIGQQEADAARSLLAALSNRDFNAAEQRQHDIASLANQTQGAYGNLLGSGLGLLADYYINKPKTTTTSGDTTSYALNGTLTPAQVLASLGRTNYGKLSLAS